MSGTVQGVGFRPFVHALARALGLTGFVGNDPAGVFVEVEGAVEQLDRFARELRERAPGLAAVDQVSVTRIQVRRDADFVIVPSSGEGRWSTSLPPDTATCPRCLTEVLDPADRRYRHPFANCTECGPRLTVVTDLPYDRAATTMADFAMCSACRREYDDPGDRRFHAQPVCCPGCGPRLWLRDARWALVAVPDPLAETVRLLLAGRVVAVKGLGGYHLAADATCEAAVALLRSRKHREAKPFAVLVPDLATAGEMCHLDDAAARVLESRQAPVVLVARRADVAVVAGSVAPGTRELGVMLPATPLHHLLVRDAGRPLVLTSGNRSEEPIAFRDDEARQRLSNIADAFLGHDRAIRTRVDDSVVRVFQGREMPVRRARGYAPAPLRLPWALARPTLACGAELKSTFCLADGQRALVSQHIGDLENWETMRAFQDQVAQWQRMFSVAPEVLVHDLHPDYLSTSYALDRAAREGLDLLGVQHHHAHVASCLADNGYDGPVVGLALDGTGFGPDGTVWGGELLVADLAGYRRAAHLELVPMPGGAAAVRQPWRMAAAWLAAVEPSRAPAHPVAARHDRQWASVSAMARHRLNSPLTSSAGRLFDAMSALLAVRDEISYEGQAAIELERVADRDESGAYPMRVTDQDPMVLLSSDLVRAALDDQLHGTEPAVVAARFHHGLARGLATAAAEVGRRTGLDTVALSGGVCQNALLLGEVVSLLGQAGLRVLVHRRVPPNDGGVSLGQVAVAAARDRAGAAVIHR